MEFDRMIPIGSVRLHKYIPGLYFAPEAEESCRIGSSGTESDNDSGREHRRSVAAARHLEYCG